MKTEFLLGELTNAAADLENFYALRDFNKCLSAWNKINTLITKLKGGDSDGNSQPIDGSDIDPTGTE